MDHAGYIIAAFAIAFAVVAGMGIGIVRDHRALTRALSRLSETRRN